MLAGLYSLDAANVASGALAAQLAVNASVTFIADFVAFWFEADSVAPASSSSSSSGAAPTPPASSSCTGLPLSSSSILASSSSSRAGQPSLRRIARCALPGARCDRLGVQPQLSPRSTINARFVLLLTRSVCPSVDAVAPTSHSCWSHAGSYIGCMAVYQHGEYGQVHRVILRAGAATAGFDDVPLLVADTARRGRGRRRSGGRSRRGSMLV